MQLKKSFGDNCVAIHHIGSTSIPGLAAKPIIDMLVVVQDITLVDDCETAMKALGYRALGEYGVPFRRFYQKGNEPKTHNVHLYEQGHPEIDRHLQFRQWMRSHPEDREAYATLKKNLAQQYPNDLFSYCMSKEAFVTEIDKKAGSNGWRFVHALTSREWEASQRLRDYFFFQPNGIEDPYTWTFEHKDHKHLILYKGNAIIGYTHVQCWPVARAAIRIMAIDEAYQSQGYGKLMLELTERWLKLQGYKSLHIESSPAALDFYQRLGYIPMPFNDPDGYEGSPEDIALGKTL